MARQSSMVAVVGVTLALGTSQASRLQAYEDGLQSYLTSLSAGRRGSAIVINPATGEVLAAWNLTSAIDDAYPPGSTAKIVLIASALEEGLVSPGERMMCHGVPPLLGAAYSCAHPVAPEGFTVSSALAESCNFFFVQLSMREDSETQFHWYSVFGFGLAAELDGMPTAAGEVRKPSDARSRALTALGEENVLATAAQLLEAYVLVANHGTEFGMWTGKIRRRRLQPVRRVALRSSTYRALTSGLVGCVEFGTCGAAAVPGVQVAGKTGTSSALDGSGATHAWFVGFAPADRPEIALVIFLERGTGAHSAAPLAGKFLRYYFAEKKK